MSDDADDADDAGDADDADDVVIVCTTWNAVQCFTLSSVSKAARLIKNDVDGGGEVSQAGSPSRAC